MIFIITILHTILLRLLILSNTTNIITYISITSIINLIVIIIKENALKEYQLQVLTKLKELRNLMINDSNTNSDIPGSTSSSILKDERDAAVAEVKLLKKEVDKLNYRIRHLVKALNEEESKH
jgi:hypothetical protein